MSSEYTHPSFLWSVIQAASTHIMALTARLQEREAFFNDLFTQSQQILANSLKIQAAMVDKERELARMRARLEESERDLRQEREAHRRTRMETVGPDSVPMSRQAGSLGHGVHSWAEKDGELFEDFILFPGSDASDGHGVREGLDETGSLFGLAAFGVLGADG